jgi:hypothetical protein
MTKRGLLLLATTTFALLGTISSSPCWARSGGAGIGYAVPHSGFAAHAPLASARLHTGAQRIVGGSVNMRGPRTAARNFGPIAVWPYLWSDDPTPEVISLAASDPHALPPIIVVAGSPDRARPESAGEPARDYSYVAGCHAIPSGYHCDTTP